ncbi:Plug domain-containing protein [Gluconobacter vitians]|uniref:Plug domain-containing protein n=1 Tax=Gluconobacter vitians TaxID=2728102 RepID=UPI001D178F58|nr:Plug domain-containing protein [Gluconobacter vitians]
MSGLSDGHVVDEREEDQPMNTVSIPLGVMLLTCAASQLICMQAYVANPSPETGSATARKAAGIRAASKQNAASLPKEDETVIVTGTRDPHQTVRKSASPIQVVTSAEISRTGQSDLRDALTQLTPSLTRAPLLIGNANMVDVLRLRGLSPNHT